MAGIGVRGCSCINPRGEQDGRGERKRENDQETKGRNRAGRLTKRGRERGGRIIGRENWSEGNSVQKHSHNRCAVDLGWVR